jgi:hypothetical protein
MAVGILDKIFGRKDSETEDAPVALDQAQRARQLERLERALDALAAEMRAESSMDNPGWRERVKDCSRLAGDAMTLRKGEITWEAVLDLAFEVRPVFPHGVPPGMEPIGPLQDEVMAAVEELRTLLPSERPR